MKIVRLLFVLLLIASTAYSYQRFSKQQQPGERTKYTREKLLQLRDNVVDMFYHGYEAYMRYAFPQDELKPVSCKGSNSFGGYSLTLIDTLDTLAMIGDDKEFFKQLRYVSENVNFNADLRVSVFETTIRVLGGLLSSHLLAEKISKKRKLLYGPSEEYSYHGELLEKAEVIAAKMMHAFDTPTGMPFNEIHLKKGVERERGQTTCPAGAGSLLLEFGLLSKLTGNCTYLIAARRALLGPWKYRSKHNLVGSMLDIFTGAWVNNEANIGASIDSFYEYLFKNYVVFNDAGYHTLWTEAYRAVQKYMLFDGWYLSSSTDKPGPLENFDHRIHALQAFWSGLQTLAGDVPNALWTYERHFCIVRHLRFMPEYCHLYAFLDRNAQSKRSGPGYPLRPEFIESTFFLHQATGEDVFFEIAEEYMLQLQRAKVPCGFAAILDVWHMTHEDKMDSFLLAETLKYLYLLFTPKDLTKESQQMSTLLADQKRNRDFYSQSHTIVRGQLVEKAKENAASTDARLWRGHKNALSVPFHPNENVIFNTEAHPVPLDADLGLMHEYCVKFEAPRIFFPTNNPSVVAQDEWASHEANSFERLSSTPDKNIWKQLQCPKINYWRDIAPFLDRVRNPDSCFSPVKAFVLRNPKSNSNFNVNDKDQRAGAVAGEPIQIAIPHDRLDPWSRPLVLFMTAKTIPEQFKKTRTFRGMLVVPIGLHPDTFYLSHSAVVLTTRLPGSRRRVGVITGNAMFGPDLCTNSRFPNSRTAGVLIPVNSNLCPSPTTPATIEDPVAALSSLFLDGAESGKLLYNLSLPNRHGNLAFGLLVLRGGCTFKEKVLMAQRLGAQFTVIGNNDNSGVVQMADADMEHPALVGLTVRIPSVMISQEDHERILKLCLQKRSVRVTADTAAVQVPFVPFVTLRCTHNAQSQYRLLGIDLVQREEGLVLVRSRLSATASGPPTQAAQYLDSSEEEAMDRLEDVALNGAPLNFVENLKSLKGDQNEMHAKSGEDKSKGGEDVDDLPPVKRQLSVLSLLDEEKVLHTLPQPDGRPMYRPNTVCFDCTMFLKFATTTTTSSIDSSDPTKLSIRFTLIPTEQDSEYVNTDLKEGEHEVIIETDGVTVRQTHSHQKRSGPHRRGPHNHAANGPAIIFEIQQGGKGWDDPTAVHGIPVLGLPSSPAPGTTSVFRHVRSTFNPPSAQDPWGPALVTRFTIRSDVCIDHHEELQDEVHRWFLSHGKTEANVLARFFSATNFRRMANTAPTAATPPKQNTGVEILVFRTMEDLQKFRVDLWEDTNFHDGHVLQQRQAMYRKVEDTETFVYERITGLFIQTQASENLVHPSDEL